MKKLMILLCAIILIGCIPHIQDPPTISDISDSAATIESFAIRYKEWDMEAIFAEATRGCNLYKKKAVALSSRCVERADNGVCVAKKFLFACS